MGVPTDLLARYEARKLPRAPFALRPGYEVRVHTLLREGEKERTQIFEGIVIAFRGSGLGKTFTVRRVVRDVGVERIFPLYSPLVTDVEVVRATKVRRAKLAYLRTAAQQKRRKADSRLMQKVEEERENARRAKEERERAAREAARAAATPAPDPELKKEDSGSFRRTP